MATVVVIATVEGGGSMASFVRRSMDDEAAEVIVSRKCPPDREAREKRPRNLAPGVGRRERSAVWDRYLKWAGRDDLIVPEGAIVALVDRIGWTPEDEAPVSGPCPTCKGRIDDGSSLYCPRCHRSGFEAKLAEQRSLRPPPVPEPPEYRPKWKGPAPKAKRGRPRVHAR